MLSQISPLSATDRVSRLTGDGVSSQQSEMAAKMKMTGVEAEKYESIFAKQVLNDKGCLGGKDAVALFQKSGLSQQQLKRIWTLADQDRDNQLSQQEFIIAMHLIICMSKRGMDTLPDTLPKDLFPTLFEQQIDLNPIQDQFNLLNVSDSNTKGVKTFLNKCQGQIRDGLNVFGVEFDENVAFHQNIERFIQKNQSQNPLKAKELQDIRRKVVDLRKKRDELLEQVHQLQIKQCLAKKKSPAKPKESFANAFSALPPATDEFPEPTANTNGFAAFEASSDGFDAFAAATPPDGFNAFPAVTPPKDTLTGVDAFDAFPKDPSPVADSGFDAFSSVSNSANAFPATTDAFDAFPAVTPPSPVADDAFDTVTEKFDAFPVSKTSPSPLNTSPDAFPATTDDFDAFPAPKTSPSTSTDAFAATTDAFPAPKTSPNTSSDAFPATTDDFDAFPVPKTSPSPLNTSSDAFAAKVDDFDAFPVPKTSPNTSTDAFPAEFDAFPVPKTSPSPAFPAPKTSESLPPSNGFDAFSAATTDEFEAFPVPKSNPSPLTTSPDEFAAFPVPKTSPSPLTAFPPTNDGFGEFPSPVNVSSSNDTGFTADFDADFGAFSSSTGSTDAFPAAVDEMDGTGSCSKED